MRGVKLWLGGKDEGVKQEGWVEKSIREEEEKGGGNGSPKGGSKGEG